MSQGLQQLGMLSWSLRLLGTVVVIASELFVTSSMWAGSQSIQVHSVDQHREIVFPEAWRTPKNEETTSISPNKKQPSEIVVPPRMPSRSVPATQKVPAVSGASQELSWPGQLLRLRIIFCHLRIGTCCLRRPNLQVGAPSNGR